MMETVTKAELLKAIEELKDDAIIVIESNNGIQVSNASSVKTDRHGRIVIVQSS